MVTTKKLWELFEVNWAMMRQNPGGKSAYIQGYLLGHAGTIDISEFLDSQSRGEIKIKVGNGPVRRVEVDFSSVTPDALEPSTSANVLQDALDEAGITDCEFSFDQETGRLKLAPTEQGVKFIQIYSDLAGALNFGNCKNKQGKGCYLWPSFDGDLKSVAETEDWTEDKEITNESHTGNEIKYVSPGKRTGTQIVVTDRLTSREAKQMINGGKWYINEQGAEVYEPPLGSDNETRRVDVFTYSPVFEKESNTEGDEKFIRERMYIGGVGKKVSTGGAGSWKEGEYTLKFGTYNNEEGEECASPRETDYSQEQWENLNLKGVLVSDWENA